MAIVTFEEAVIVVIATLAAKITAPVPAGAEATIKRRKATKEKIVIDSHTVWAYNVS